LDDLEYVFARVGTADVSDDVLGVAVVHAEHLDGLLFVSNLFLEFALDILHEVDFPGAGCSLTMRERVSLVTIRKFWWI